LSTPLYKANPRFRKSIVKVQCPTFCPADDAGDAVFGVVLLFVDPAIFDVADYIRPEVIEIWH
jgi:hypothetical protein